MVIIAADDRRVLQKSPGLASACRGLARFTQSARLYTTCALYPAPSLWSEGSLITPFMQVFLYEYLTGGGMWQQSGKPPGGSLLAEGRAMIQAVAADFAALPKMEVVTIRDSRLAALHPATCRVTIVVSEV